MATSSDLRYAHAEGLMSLCVDSISKKLLTCGQDGDARCWENFETDDPTSYRVGENATSLCSFDNKMYVADENGAINVFDLTDGVPHGFITKFTLPVNHMDISYDGRYILAGSADFSLKVFDLVSDNKQIVLETGQSPTHPILSVSFDAGAEYAAASCCDGTVKVWRLEYPVRPEMTLNVLDKSNDINITKSLARIHFQPKDSPGLLAVPVKSKVNIYEKESWSMEKSLQSKDSPDEVFSVCRFSDDGRFLAAASLTGTIVVWKMDTDEQIAIFKHPKSRIICGLLWHPTYKNRLIFCDTDGFVGVWKGFLSSSENIDVAKPKFSDKVQNDDASTRGSFLDDEASCDSNIGALKAKYNKRIFADADNNEDTQFVDIDDNQRTKSDRLPTVFPIAQEIWKPKPYQKSFVVNSTPEHLSERFMKWNSVGIVRQYNNDEESSVEIEFHDVTVHHAFQVSNSQTGYCMADLNDEAVALVSRQSATGPARLNLIHFGAWDLSKEWSVDLPQGQEPVCVCLSTNWVAVAVSTGNIWIFTISGFQLKNFLLPTASVTMAAYRDVLAIVYNDGHDSDGYPLYHVKLLTGISSLKNINAVSIRVPVTVGHSLTWVGFSTLGNLCVCDSNGIVTLYDGGCWMPIFNACLPNSDFFWIISVHDAAPNRHMRGVRCFKSKDKYPTLLPKPVPCVMDWHTNLCDTGLERRQLEEAFMLSSISEQNLNLAEMPYDHEAIEKETFQATLKLFLLACNSERDCRAYDIARLVDKSSTLNALYTIASKKGRRVLAEKISVLLSQRAALELEKTEMSTSVLSVEPSRRPSSRQSTQPLFSSNAAQDAPSDNEERPDLEDEDNNDRQPSPPVDNNYTTPLGEKHVKNRLNFVTNGDSTPNPFKKNTNPYLDKEPVEVDGIGKSVFDLMSMNRKRTSANESLNGISDTFNADSSKKQRKITLKKQARLSFGSVAKD